MTIEKYCNSDVVTITPDASIQEAAKLMEEKCVGSLLVLKNGNQLEEPVGIVTDRDLVVKIMTQKDDLTAYKVSDAMSEDLLVLPHDLDLKAAVESMTSRGVRRAPIQRKGKICGIMSLDDVMIKIARDIGDIGDLIEYQINR